MPSITTKDGVDIFYKDWGKGQPIVFSHGWPLSADDWDTQMIFFVNNGFRVIAHDRRGHGRSSQVADGHDMDHYADDLAAPGPRRPTRASDGCLPRQPTRGLISVRHAYHHDQGRRRDLLQGLGPGSAHCVPSRLAAQL